MIVGSGLIAKAFEKYNYDNDVLIFSSGVSNSKENRSSEFEREETLIKEYININKKFIYFSTVSVVDGSKNSPYIEHKLNIEKFISENHNNYLIFRLPIVVGINSNKVTFFNTIKNKIINNEVIDIYNVKRYLIDIDDLSSTLPIIIDDKNERNKTINVCYDNFTTVIDIVNKMEFFLKTNSPKNFIESDSNYEVDNHFFKTKFPLDYYDYNDRLIEKYSKI
jgi:nucleoside-diphosphate-sugar epimerase